MHIKSSSKKCGQLTMVTHASISKVCNKKFRCIVSDCKRICLNLVCLNINEVNTNLVGDGGGYEIPRWLGDNKFDWPDVPGTSRVLLLMLI